MTHQLTHAAFQYERPLKRQQQAFSRTLEGLWFIERYVRLVYRCVYASRRLFSVCRFASKPLDASHSEVSLVASHPCRHYFSESSAERSNTTISPAGLWWLTALWPKKRAFCVYYPLYSTPTLRLRRTDIQRKEDRRKRDAVLNKAHLSSYSGRKKKRGSRRIPEDIRGGLF